MIPSRLLLPLFVCLTFLISGCATDEGTLLSTVEKGNLQRLKNLYGTSDDLQKQIDWAQGDPTGAKRNILLNDLILLVDLHYDHWEKLLYDKKAYSDFGTAVVATSLSSVASLTGAAETKTVFSAISGGITSTGVTFNSKVLQDQSLTAILAKMRADRATALLALQAHMLKSSGSNGPGGPNPLSVYSVQQGLIDINSYYNAGTFVPALQDIMAKAATQKTNAETQSTNLKPNAGIINAAKGTTVTVQKLAPVVIDKTVVADTGLQPPQISAITKAAGALLMSATNPQAATAAANLRLPVAAGQDPHEAISEALSDSNISASTATNILKELQNVTGSK